MSTEIVDWSDLPEELVDEVANRLFSSVELFRVRSICKAWRCAVSSHKSYPNHRKRHCRRVLSPYNGKQCSLSPAAFFRVILSLNPDKGWLIKTQDVSVFNQLTKENEFSEFSKQLISPLSRRFINSSDKTLDLLDFTVSEIHQSYGVYLKNSWYNISLRIVLVNHLVFKVDCLRRIWWCNTGEISNNVWTRILDEEAEYFSDIIVHKGQIYALDLTGAIWWISLSDLNIYQYGPSTPLDYCDIDDCKDKRLVEYCEDVCVVHHFRKKFCKNGKVVEETVGFKVYKMDEELVEWVEVKSLGDKAFIMATDVCFSVLAREYYGCLENSIYFTDNPVQKNLTVFNLGDASIINMVDSPSQTFFQMFSPPFVNES